jgi:thiol-disulfide isomerase/thioredoxin
MEGLGTKSSATPSIMLINGKSIDGVLPPSYTGPIREAQLVEWALRHIKPVVGELAFSNPAGEAFTTAFFSARKLKFILLLKPIHVGEGTPNNVLDTWKAVAERNKEQALFSFMVDEIADVMEYFNVSSSDLPMIVGHISTNDYKYKSPPRTILDPQYLHGFVSDVISGKISRIFKSEPPPTKKMQEENRGVVIATGNTVESIAFEQGKDVLLYVYTPWCVQCKKMRPSFETLARAVQAEPRIVVAKIDGAANDLPTAWDIRGYPTLLLFKSSDKIEKSSKKNAAIPVHYSELGFGLHDLFKFIITESSFDENTLHVATPEQIGSLLGDEDLLRLKYETIERWEKRNEGRTLLENEILDYFAGEVVFDGKRWHVLLVGVLFILFVFAYILSPFIQALGTKKKAPTSTGSKGHIE